MIAIAADGYDLNIGVSGGGSVGKHYLVYADGEDIVDFNGAPLGSYKVPLAVLVTKGVSTTESFCEVYLPSKGWIIQTGDKVIPISREAADHIKFAMYNTIPDAPRLKGYNGRWIRVGSVMNPFSAIVKYDSWWSLLGLPANVPPAPPGYYYADVRTVQYMPANAYSPPRPGVSVRLPWQAPAERTPKTFPPEPSPAARITQQQPVYPDSWRQFDFDVNQVTDAKLIRTFPLADVEKYSLEIQHRGAWNFYSNKRYREAYDAFRRQSFEYYGNYLSPYWAGRSAQQLGNLFEAKSWFNEALRINPNYQPAKNALDEISKQTDKEERKHTSGTAN